MFPHHFPLCHTKHGRGETGVLDLGCHLLVLKTTQPRFTHVLEPWWGFEHNVCQAWRTPLFQKSNGVN